MWIYVLLNSAKKKKKKKNIELLIIFQMETTLDFNSHICNMDGLKYECLDSTIAFVFFFSFRYLIFFIISLLIYIFIVLHLLA